MGSIVIRTVEMAILDTLRGIQKKYGKGYCFPSQKTILERLRTIHGIDICRRTLNYWLKKLEGLKLIKRFKRHTREKDGKGNKTGPLHLRSTAYYICQKAGGAARARKFIGFGKRLRSLFPSAVQKIALNRFQEKHTYAVQDNSEAAPIETPPSVCSKGVAILEGLGFKVPERLKVQAK